MTQTFTGRRRVRKFFGSIREVAEMPNLIEVQKASYDQFLLVEEPVHALSGSLGTVMIVGGAAPVDRFTGVGAHHVDQIGGRQ